MKEFDAKVVRSDESSIILDQTCFFPQGGGQAGDTGQVSVRRGSKPGRGRERIELTLAHV